MRHNQDMNFPTKDDVDAATADDLAAILRWLQREYECDNEGFWCNRDIISKALQDGALYVIRLNGEAVAYQVGMYAADIANVRQDLKCRGYGTALFEASFDRAYRDEVNVLAGQCMPTDSLPFWERCGFQRYPDRHRPNDILVRRFVERTFILPEGPRIAVEIVFYPEGAVHGVSVGPVVAHCATGARLDDGSIQLDHRAIGAKVDEPEGRDLVIRIVIDGQPLCQTKAKYDEAKKLGVVEDGDSFFVDRITTDT